MLEKLDFMIRFWNLRARYGAVGSPLSPVERIELLSLLRLMMTDHPLPDPGPSLMGEAGIPVQITGDCGFLAGELRLVCADGVLVTGASTLRAGQRTIVRLADAVSGVEYALPCVVKWALSGTMTAMALVIDGAPTRSRLNAPGQEAWLAVVPFGWAEPQRPQAR